ncbi:L-tyrosine:2-oxoglutarate aminotransferase amt1 [Trichinella spiralis]|uniref:L-tyrosine:2-oxoglutarate aminotransferase amt1 n=1 Tax=Trichinella spiralis TaxID=6334 RepID=A0ABR3KXJ4_TRISP
MSDREFFLAFMMKNFMQIGIRLDVDFVEEKRKSLPRDVRQRVEAFIVNENIMNVLVALNNMIWNQPNHMVPLSKFIGNFMEKYQTMFQLFSEPSTGIWIIATDHLPFYYEIQSLIEMALPDF